LFLEDNENDVERMQHELSRVRMEFIAKRVTSRDDFLHDLTAFCPDIILANYSLPTFNGMEALHLLKQTGSTIPFILIINELSEQLVLEYLKEGIDDFILTSSYKRLPLAIESAIRKKEVEREKQIIAAELERSHNELQLLLERQQISLEEERKNIARDLHDELGQVLTALKIDVSMLRKKINPNGTQKKWVDQDFQSITNLINRIAQSVKRIAGGLRPEILDELGLIEAIRSHIHEFEKRHKITCHMSLPANSLALDNNSSIALFRIIQEVLTNAAKHSGATTVWINLQVESDSMVLEIKDDGKGLSPESLETSGSLGIVGLRERVRLLNGTFRLTGEADKGTLISVTVPFKKSLAEAL
jgi:two-component system, NarL family, sensor histidine kinase UhpB